MRHAKSDWPANTGDLERPLTSRGRKDAVVAGSWLGNRSFKINQALVSPSRRTRQTWELVAANLGYEVKAEIEESIYEAHPGALLAVVQGLQVETAILVGHGPGIPRLAALLAANQDAPQFERLRMKYPTCAISVLHSQEHWADWAPGCAELSAYEIPRADPLAADND